MVSTGNVGIATGLVNNLIVLDVDYGDSGIDEFNEYISQYGEPLTVKQLSPNRGVHYFFNLPSDGDALYLSQLNQLTNSTKYRGKGLDIRSNGGYILSSPSETYVKGYNEDNQMITTKMPLLDAEGKVVTDIYSNIIYQTKSYRYQDGRGFDDIPVIDMPLSLIEWLMEGKSNGIKSKTGYDHMMYHDDLSYIYKISQVVEYLDLLPSAYYDDNRKWKYVTHILSSEDDKLFGVWDTWSSKSANYNYIRNKEIWDAIKMEDTFKLSCLVYLLKKENKVVDDFVSFKEHIPITTDISSIKTTTSNNEYVTGIFSFDEFVQNETVVIQACAGTGKTYAMAKYCGRYFKDANKKLISIVGRVSLSREHHRVFNEHEVKLVSYEDENKNVYDDSIVVCINSLLILQDLSDEDLKDYVLYIDEISTFTENLCDNDQLDKILKSITILLNRMLLHCHKVVVADALINDSAFEILKHRPNSTKIYAINEFQKFLGVPAIAVRNASDFLDKIVNQCQQNKAFLFGCDCKKIVTDYYAHCTKYFSAEDVASKFILITRDSKFEVKDAKIDFRGKFVFYSPSITYGIDYNVLEKQNVYIYIQGNSIMPNSSYQQTTRTRNIDTVYVHCCAGTHNMVYRSIDDVKKESLNLKTASNLITNMCASTDAMNNCSISENTFFDLYCYTIYVKDTYKTNMYYHYFAILMNNGFKCDIYLDRHKEVALPKTIKYEMEDIVTDQLEQEFIDFISSDHIDRLKVRYDKFNNALKVLHLERASPELLIQYHELITDTKCLDSHFNLIRLMKTQDYINENVERVHLNSQIIKAHKSSYHKINIIKKLEAQFNIKPLDVGFEESDEPIDINPGLFKLIQKDFRSQRSNPKTLAEFKPLYISMIKTVIGTSLKMITTKTNRSKDGKSQSYALDHELLAFHVKLNQYNNPLLNAYEPHLIETYGMIPYVKPLVDVSGLDAFIETEDI